MSDRWAVHHGDCREVMQAMEPESIDSIVSDPPYGLSFMGKGWDHGVPGVEFWEAALRVAKPGCHLLAFGGTRTFHRLTVAIEDAGWEIRDCLMWVYGSGFPKSHDVSKAIDREAGAERETVLIPTKAGNTRGDRGATYATETHAGFRDISTPQTDAASQWQGWGTALKPSHEPVILARKPLPEDAERDKIIKDLFLLESQLCLLMSDAWLAEATLMSSLAVEKLLDIARWTAEDRTNTRADLFGQMDMSQCELVIRFCLNTVSSWKGIWEDASIPTSTFITAMASSTTIGWKTLRSCVSALTLPCIIRAASEHGGSWHNVVPAAAIFNAVSVSTSGIQTLSVHASAIEQGLISHPAAIDKRRLHRPIILARKPPSGTVAANVLEHGTGAINVDGCRIPTDGEDMGDPSRFLKSDAKLHDGWQRPHKADGEKMAERAVDRFERTALLGRWPANLIHDGSDEVVGLMAEAARFFYCAKASKRDRDEGCEGLEERACKNCTTGGNGEGDKRTIGRQSSIEKEPLAKARNHHPTVKPTDWMRYLCRLITPPDGLVFDPFTGSGSTGKAAMLEGFRFVGAELSPEYIEIARARIGHAAGKTRQKELALA